MNLVRFSPSLSSVKKRTCTTFPPITNHQTLKQFFPHHNSIQSRIKSQTNNALIILPNSKVEDRKREQRVLYPLSFVLEWCFHCSKHRCPRVHTNTYTCPLVTKGSRRMHASIHTPKKQLRMHTRVYARENLLFVRPRRYADDKRPPIDIFFLFFSSFR